MATIWFFQVSRSCKEIESPTCPPFMTGLWSFVLFWKCITIGTFFTFVSKSDNIWNVYHIGVQLVYLSLQKHIVFPLPVWKRPYIKIIRQFFFWNSVNVQCSFSDFWVANIDTEGSITKLETTKANTIKINSYMYDIVDRIAGQQNPNSAI